MINRLFQNFDIFAQSFQFNSSKQDQRKRTCLGGFLSLLISIITLIYFLYLNYQYFSNQFPPKFRSQSFVTNEDIKISMHNDLIAFRFTSFYGNGTLDALEAQSNKTYLVFIAILAETNSQSMNITSIDITQCSNPQLNGYRCLDLSKLPSKYLINGNINKILSYLNIQIYRCHDIDYQKQTIPDNCANPEEISSYLSNTSNMLNVKLYTSQYNTNSKAIETNFKNFNILIPYYQKISIETRAQTHNTLVKDGLLIQSQQPFSSPISYLINQQTLGQYQDNPRTLLPANYIINVGYSVDETVQYIDIQFSTYPEVLTLCNSTLALLMCIGFFGRQMAQQVIKQELFLFILQNIFKGTFQKILKVNHLQVYHDIIQLEGVSQSFQAQIQINEEHQGQIRIPPSMAAKHQESVLNSKKRIPNNDKFQDEIKESVISQMNTQYSPKINTRANSQNISQENNLLQPQIVFASKLKAYQSIKKDIELQNSDQGSQQSIKLQNIQVESKMQDLCKKQNLLNSIHSRIFNQELSQKIERKLFSLKLCNKKKDFEKKGLNKIAVQSINSQVINTLDFVSFYKDIIMLKKAIMVLLSKEQLAALELVGCTDMFFEGGNIDKIDHKGNHFEQQLRISQSEELKCKYIEDFINQCQQSQNLSRIDQRIFTSLI
ncbi:hypothetical protein ABPG72_008688 [Tetrahymena utriculariae]